MIYLSNMGLFTRKNGYVIPIILVAFLVFVPSVTAFGAGNIPSISSIEGINFRHGDIEDMLKTVACIKGHKWTSMMIKRVYFGNWLRDYSQAVDVGSLKGVSAPTIRILVWVLSFLSFGYATQEFEVTDERLGVYRPEEHIDNPKDYADNKDARHHDPRLRGPVQKAELEIDMNTGMKNYIANEYGGWATSSGYVKFSLSRSIHFGRLYTSGSGNSKGNESDLCEALRCLGQALHCLEDFSAHSNYVELALREMGYRDVFPHTGVSTELNIQGHYIYPLTTGTFGAVDFLHSVLGEATDHFTQTEVDEMDLVLKNAEKIQDGDSRKSSLFGSGSDLIRLLKKVPGLGLDLSSTAKNLKSASEAKQLENTNRAGVMGGFQYAPENLFEPGDEPSGPSSEADPMNIIKKIYPILEFRDKVVKAINKTIAKIPGLESLVERISETLTLFILSLLSPYIRPIIDTASKTLKQGSSTVVAASANSQFEPWNDPYCTDPTHSMLAKDHFSNKLNGVAGRVASSILQYVTPRVLYAWENPDLNVDEVTADIIRVFHHPALRDESLEIHRNMFHTVRQWVDEQPDRHNLNEILGSASVKAGRNHQLVDEARGLEHNHGLLGGHGKTSGSIWTEIQKRDLAAMEGTDGRYAFSDVPESGYEPHTNDFQGNVNIQFQNQPTPNNEYYQSPMHSQQPGPPNFQPLYPNPAAPPGGYWPQMNPGYHQHNPHFQPGVTQTHWGANYPPVYAAPYPSVNQHMYQGPYPGSQGGYPDGSGYGAPP